MKNKKGVGPIIFLSSIFFIKLKFRFIAKNVMDKTKTITEQNSLKKSFYLIITI